MTNRSLLLTAALALSTACNSAVPEPAARANAAVVRPASEAAPAGQPEVEPRLAEIERRTGGRLGVALVDSEGRLLISHRAEERFAMCSTFKLPLAGMILEGAEKGRWRLDEALPVGRGDMLSNSPISEQHLAAGRITMGAAAAGIVTHSDNSGSNLLLRRVGGPEAFTAWLREKGDQATRLDRFELGLNENAASDPRDTTMPLAMARTTQGLVYGDLLSPAGREVLAGWMSATRTGVRRIRAGLPAGWPAGDKTGTCGTAYNDVAWFHSASGLGVVLAVYLDRPTVSGTEAEAAIADVARFAEEVLR